MVKSTSMQQRRRGADLEHAILDAAWSELVAQGYAGLTLQDVASKAGTSRSVIARRWDSKTELSIAALRHQAAQHPFQVADHGDLRTELLEYMDCACDRTEMVAVLFSMLSSESFSSLQEVRAAVLNGNESVMAMILQRAVKRGEINAEKLTPVVATLLSDLLRHHAIMTFSPPSPELRTAWVDEIFLPLVRKRT